LWSERMKRMNSTRPWAGRPAGISAGGRGAPVVRAGGLVGRTALGGSEAVLGVVGALKRAGTLGAVLAVAEALLAEGALVEGCR
jgi:hypothetical protein